ncbi:MAG TPA: 4-vinyl reductase [Myxococcota bacterium]|nr:4-vinyl reductase [Myxococcota bacterium]HRY94366.1 4-vinyl reductase [Myxococcota bacterium]HSA24058.1 4-vinyl reductase [Myxococcota bacterium]
MGGQAVERPTKALSVGGPGRLQLGPGRVLLMRPETLAELQRGVEDRLGPKAPEYLYAAGAAWAHDAAKRVLAATGEEGVELVRLVCQQATELGWGEWRVEAFRAEEKALAVRVLGSPFAEAYGSADTPACHLAAGAVGGLTEFVFRVPAPCTEQACLVQGAPGCLFVAAGQEVDAADSWSW